MTLVLALLALWATIVIVGLCNTVGYHRLLTHRSFKTQPLVRNAMTFLAAQYSGAPMPWVGAHRVHHTLSDKEGDPHSPRKGFWHAHCGWLFGTDNPVACFFLAASGFALQVRFFLVDVWRLSGKHPPKWRTLTRDLEKEPFMRFLDVPLVLTACFLGQVGIAWGIGGWWGIAWLWFVHAFLNNGTWIVNSACHSPRFGVRPHTTSDGSRNVGWLALITHGEASHNTHHKFPRSARHGLEGEPDASWALIRTMERLGLAWDVQLPRERTRTHFTT